MARHERGHDKPGFTSFKAHRTTKNVRKAKGLKAAEIAKKKELAKSRRQAELLEE